MITFVLVAPGGFMMTARTQKRVIEKSWHRIGTGDVPYRIYEFDNEKTMLGVDEGGYFIYDGRKPTPTAVFKPVRPRRHTRRRMVASRARGPRRPSRSSRSSRLG